MEFDGIPDDRLAQMREIYLAEEHERNNTRYGWVRA